MSCLRLVLPALLPVFLLQQVSAGDAMIDVAGVAANGRIALAKLEHFEVVTYEIAPDGE